MTDSRDWRIKRLDELQHLEGGKAPLGRMLGYKDGAFVGQMLRGERPITEKTIDAVHALPGRANWFSPLAPPSPSILHATEHHAPYHAPASDGQEPDLVITQYATGGAMGHGFVLSESPPGIIKSWRVTPEWLRLNVPIHTGLHNLSIVTGFGPSMRGMFNPGDPLLVDRGVTKITHDGVYFFRVGDEGFIKIVQRIPDKDGLRLRVISKNEEYPPYDITPKDFDFEVLAKVLTVWKSEQH